MIAAIRLTPAGYHSLAPLAAGLVVVALVVVLAGAELCRAYGSDWAEVHRRWLLSVAEPLLLCSVVVLLARLVPLIR
jgi:hypothetical protein